MNIRDVKKLVELMVENDLNELDISDSESRILLRRGQGGAPVVTTMPAAGAPAAPAAQAPAETPPQAQEQPPAEEQEELIEVKSPMVGTFYTAPSPDSDPYVSNGSHINDDTVVCIIEAMKVMNEIKAECTGTVSEICVKNAQPVEFGQVLFRVKPD